MTTAHKKKSGWGYLSLLAIITLTAGGIYYWRGALLGKKLTPLEAAQAVPQEALLTSYISTEPQDWSQLSQLGTPEAQKVLGKKFEQLKADLSNEEINYVKDIQPWLGGVMLAVMPSDIAQDPQVLIIAGIKNKLKAQQFQDKLKNQPKQTLTHNNYKGITITNINTAAQDSYSVSTVGNYLILADKNQPIEQAIDTLKGEPSYAQKPGAKQLLSQSLSLKHSVAQVYLIDYATLIEQGFKNGSPDASIAPDTLKQLKQIESMIIGLGVENEGLHLQAIAKLSPDALKLAGTSASGKILELFPSQTFALVSGHGIKEGWSNLVTQAQNDPALELGLAQIRQSLKTLNLDADKDVFSWMDGEFALGTVFTNQSAIPLAGIGGLLIWDTSDRASAENTLNKLNQIAQQYNISVQPNQVDGIDITDWKIQPENLLLSYGWLDKDSIVITLGMPFSEVTHVKPNNSLAQSQNFQAMTRSLPKNNLGYFYLDLNQAVAQIMQISQQQGMTPDPETMAILNSLQGLAVTATMPDKTTSQFDLLLALKSSQ